MTGVQVQPIRAGSVSELAYEKIRDLIVDGAVPPSSRLRQGELADALGISRTSVREALHRLAAEELVDFQRNRGFFVAGPLRFDAVINRLEVRLILEPGIARLAAERRTDADAQQIDRVVKGEAKARSARAAHDLSREFHMLLAHATGNSELTQVLHSLWTVDIGRQLLARRVETPTWQAEDVAEHAAIAAAVADKNGELAAELMQRHVAAAWQHWSERAAAGSSGHQTTI